MLEQAEQTWRVVNSRGKIVRNFEYGRGLMHSFLYRDGTFNAIGPPGSTLTLPVGIDRQGQTLISSRVGNFLYGSGIFALFNVPGFPFGINDFDQVVRQVCPNTGCHDNVDTRGSIELIVDGEGREPTDTFWQCRI